MPAVGAGYQGLVPRALLVGGRPQGVLKGCGQGMINEEEGEKGRKNRECEKECVNSGCSSVTPQMGLTSACSRRNKAAPAVRGRTHKAGSWERNVK